MAEEEVEEAKAQEKAPEKAQEKGSLGAPTQGVPRSALVGPVNLPLHGVQEVVRCLQFPPVRLLLVAHKEVGHDRMCTEAGWFYIFCFEN